jgi:hypothetical protein
MSTAVSIWKYKRQQKWKYKAASELGYKQLGGPDGPVSVGPPQPLIPKFASSLILPFLLPLVCELRYEQLGGVLHSLAHQAPPSH